MKTTTALNTVAKPLSVLAIICILAAVCRAQTSVSRPTTVTTIKTSNYDRLDQTRLADSLSSLGLTDMLASLADELESTDPAGALYARAEIAISQAGQVRHDLDKFLPLMNEAVANLRQAANTAATPPDEYSLLECYRIKMRLADTEAILLCQPYMEQLFLLQGGPTEHKFVLDHTEKPIADLSLLGEAIDQTLKGWHEKSKASVMVILAPTMEELKTQVAYKLGYAMLCRSLAMDDRDKTAKSRLLLNARMAIEAIIKDTGNESGLRYWSLLLSGRASRELKDFGRAIADLQQACAAEAQTPVRVAAGFEIIRTLVEKQDFESAKRQAEVFRKDAAALLGAPTAVIADVQYALLKNYLYEQWADSIRASDAITANTYDRNAQEALLQFICDHPDDQYSFCELIASKYQGQADLSHARAMTLCAVAISERLKYAVGDTRRAAALQKSQALIQAVLAGTDSLAQQVHPLATFNLAVIQAEQGNSQQAGVAFAELARKYPTNSMAFTSVCNAAAVYNSIIQAQITAGRAVSDNCRRDLVGAIELMFSRPEWAETAKAKQWYFSLGWQYDKLADGADEKTRPALIQKAITAYQSAVATLQGTQQLEARQLALLNQAELLGTLVDSDQARQKAIRREEAGKLLPLFQTFVTDATKAADAAESAGQKNDADNLRQRAGAAEFQQAVVMNEYLEQKAPALAILQAVAKKWPGTPAVQESTKYLIRLALLANKTTEAIKLVEEFRQAYPQQAPAMIHLVVKQLEEQISQLRYDPSAANELSQYRLAYGRLAAILYQQQLNTAGSDAEAVYPYKQLLGSGKLEEALALRGLNNSSAEDIGKLLDSALEIFTGCKTYDDNRRNLLAKQIDDKFSRKLAELQQASADAEKLKAMAREFLTDAQAESATAVKNALDSVAKDGQKGLDELRKSLANGYTDWPKILKRQLQIDAINLWGLARTNRAMGRYEQAMDIYKAISNGIARSDKDGEAMYWRAELEYCQCTMECYNGKGESQKAYANLSMRIRQLKMDNPGNMGALFERFSAIQAQADSLSQQK